MRHVLLLSAAPILLGLAISPVEARGGGGFGGGHGGVGFNAPAFHLGVNRIARPVISQQQRRNQLVIRRNLLNNGRFFNNGRFSGRRFARRGFPLDGTQFIGGWPVGWGWSDVGTTQVVAPEPIQPQVIVIRSDPSGRQMAQDTHSDDSYVAGCRPIPNGYHCDVQ